VLEICEGGRRSITQDENDSRVIVYPPSTSAGARTTCLERFEITWTGPATVAARANTGGVEPASAGADGTEDEEAGVGVSPSALTGAAVDFPAENANRDFGLSLDRSCDSLDSSSFSCC
jgi:hypothetical protein